MIILVFDPGESTGWVCGDGNGVVDGGTIGRDHLRIAELIDTIKPDLLILESFALYPGKAKAMSWNTFYPVEVIGVIKYMCMKESIPIVEQAPSVKKYAGGFGPDWDLLKSKYRTTEHTKDAYQHLKYYLLHTLKKR